MKHIRLLCKIQDLEEYNLYIELFKRMRILMYAKSIEIHPACLFINISDDNSFYIEGDHDQYKRWFIDDVDPRDISIYNYQEALRVLHKHRGTISCSLLGIL